MLYATFVESSAMLRGFFGNYFFINTLLIILQVLNSFWFFLVMGMVQQFVTQGYVRKDASQGILFRGV